MMSAKPSPVTSPAAKFTPPVNAELKAKNERTSAPVLPSNTLMCGPPPRPGAVMTSGTPSPVTLPTAGGPVRLHAVAQRQRGAAGITGRVGLGQADVDGRK